MEKMIYLDNAATTMVSKEVIDAMLPYLNEYYANPSAIYKSASRVRDSLEEARELIAKSLNCKFSEIYFTSGGTESNNWAIKEFARAYAHKGKHIITTKIEHHAVLNTCSYLEKEGFEITYLDVDREGIVSAELLKQSIREDTILISIMYANNEIGSIQEIKSLAEIAKSRDIAFHTDAVQAYAHIDIDVKDLQVDMLSASAHKFHGPKGVGFLYINSRLKLKSFIHGGSQERKRRAGTENVASIVGMAKASELAFKHMDKHSIYIKELRDYLKDRLLKEIEGLSINGSLDKRLYNNLSIRIKSISAELLMIMLDGEDICVSSGSACASGSIDPSHVLMALGLDAEEAGSSIRISLSAYNNKEELEVFIEKLKMAVDRLRGMPKF